MKKKKNQTPSVNSETKENTKKALEKYLLRFTSPKERAFFREFIVGMIENKTLPEELIEFIPIDASESGKTRFDQLYDGIMSIRFPNYRQETLRRMLGPITDSKKSIKLWRAVFPEKFGILHIYLRAESYQEAFARACDYACRLSLRLYKRIPHDLTIRVMFVSEKAIRRKLDMRWANRVKKRKEFQLEGRDFTPKEISGARLVALGHPKNKYYDIVKYSEEKDLLKILHSKNRIKISEIESEHFKK